MKRAGSWCGWLGPSVPAIALLVGAALAPAVPALATVMPVITTTQVPASAVVGSTIIDVATVTGSEPPIAPTGTVTFDLYSSATVQNASTLLFTNMEPLPEDGGTATTAGYTTIAAGTDYWVDSYNGDANYLSVTSDPTAEPVMITAANPADVPEPSSLAVFSFALSGIGIVAWVRKRQA
jgi:hypothetical protein